jgi:catechol 2,3-dioxygenase-like lactoylglutathione lyase family enzyme
LLPAFIDYFADIAQTEREMAVHGTSVGLHLIFCLFAHVFLTYATHRNFVSEINGFHHVGITTSELATSRIFYVDVLGGTHVDGLDGLNLQGNGDFNVLFQKEVLEARETNASLDDVKVPDIRPGGIVGLNLNFILFDNLVVELLQYREIARPLVYDAHYKYKSVAYINTMTLSFWVKDGVDLEDFIKRLESAAKDKSVNIQVNRLSTGSTTTSTVSFDMSPNFEGMTVAHVIGPSGELIEFIKITGSLRTRFRDALQMHNTVTKAFSSSETSCNSNEPLRNCLYGFHHIGVTTDDFTSSLKFYTNVMGGILLTDFTGNNIYGDGIYESLLQYGIDEVNGNVGALKMAGIPNLRDNGMEKYDVVFVLFPNMLVRLGRFSNRPSGDILFDARHPSSPAYISSCHLAFWVKSTIDLNQLIKDVETDSHLMGLSQIQGNRAVDVAVGGQNAVDLSDYSHTVNNTGTNFDGLSYSYMKGPSGEQLEFFQLKGKADDAFRKAFCERGSVSVAYSKDCPGEDEGHEDEKKESEEEAPNTVPLAIMCSVAIVIAICASVWACYTWKLRKTRPSSPL